MGAGHSTGHTTVPREEEESHDIEFEKDDVFRSRTQYFDQLPDELLMKIVKHRLNMDTNELGKNTVERITELEATRHRLRNALAEFGINHGINDVGAVPGQFHIPINVEDYQRRIHNIDREINIMTNRYERNNRFASRLTSMGY